MFVLFNPFICPVVFCLVWFGQLFHLHFKWLFDKYVAIPFCYMFIGCFSSSCLFLLLLVSSLLVWWNIFFAMLGFLSLYFFTSLLQVFCLWLPWGLYIISERDNSVIVDVWTHFKSTIVLLTLAHILCFCFHTLYIVVCIAYLITLEIDDFSTFVFSPSYQFYRWLI